MDKEDINLGTETEQLEFKKSTGEIKEAIISIVAILNKHHKGTLYFGVKNDGTVVGQDITDETTRSVSRAVGNHIRPALYPTISKEVYGNRTVIKVEFEGNNCPYLAYNIPRIRVADEDLVMDQYTYDEMIRKRDDNRNSWECQLSDYMISDVDNNIFNSYLDRAKKVGRISFDSNEPKTVLTKLELTKGDHLLNAGAALFVDCGINELALAKFATNERLTFTDLKRYTGSILDLMSRAEQYVIDGMDWRAVFNGKQRKEIPEVPLDAVHEAIVNAFAHRDIENGQSVEVIIFKNRIEVTSPGHFPDGKTPEMFIQGNEPPIRRNRLITRTLYYSKDMESFATGLKRIQDSCDKAGVKVEYRADQNNFVVIFYRHCGDGWGWSSEHEEMSSANGTRSGTRNGTRKNEYEDAVLNAIRNNDKITRKELAELLGTSIRTISRVIQELPQINYVGKGKNGHWKIT